MKQVNFPLKLQMKRPAVADLHKRLVSLGFKIAASEQKASRFGASTRQAILAFQGKHGLPPSGEVDAATARLLKKPMKPANVSDASTTLFTIHGRAAFADSKPAAGAIVRAFDQDVARAALLGEATTDAAGQYTISYAESQFRQSPGERGGPDLFVQVLAPDGSLMGRSKVQRNSPADCTIDIQVTSGKFRVFGRVTQSDGAPAIGWPVVAVDRDLRTEQPLGSATTDEHGNYEILYAKDQFARAEKDRADLVVRVFDKASPVSAEGASPLAESAIQFNAQPEVKLDLSLPNPEAELSEYERDLATLTPLLEGQGVTLAALTEADIDFLSGEATINRQHIAWLALSYARSAETAFPPLDDAGHFIPLRRIALLGSDVLYAWFRQGLPTELSALLQQSADALRQALLKSIDGNIAPARLAGQVDDIVVDRLGALHAHLELQAAGEAGKASLGELLGTIPSRSGMLDRDRLTFAKLYREFGPSQRLWSEAQAKGLAERIPALRRTLALSEIAQAHMPVIEALQAREGADDACGPASFLAAVSRDEWIDLALDHGAPASTALSPLDYALEMESTVEQRFTTAVLRERLRSGAVQIQGLPAQPVAQVLSEHPDFDIRSENVGAFLERVAAQPPEVADGLRRIQRVLPIAGTINDAALLLNKGFDSAQAIVHAGADALASRFEGALSREQVLAIHAAAQNATATQLALVSRLSQRFNPLATPMLGKRTASKELLAKYPNLRTLFGDLDFCECTHCSSVLGPAAYLADLLTFVRRSGSNVLGALIRRRFDLLELELSCDNTNVEIPYVDLVLEVLENAVALPCLVPIPPHGAADLVNELQQGRVPKEIGATLARTAICMGQVLTVMPAPDVWGNANSQLWRIDDGSRSWIAAHVPAAMWADLGDFGAAIGSGRIVEFPLDSQSQEALERGELPKAWRDMTQPWLQTAKVEQVPVPGKAPESWRRLADPLRAYRVSLTFEVILEIVPGARSTVLRLHRADGRVQGELKISNARMALVTKWLHGDLLGAREAKEVCDWLQLPPLNWRRTLDAASGRWALTLQLLWAIVLYPESLGVVSLTYRSSSVRADLFATPENRNPLAYQVLRNAVFPWSQPFYLSIEEMRAFLVELGVTRQALMEIARPKDRDSRTYVGEVLGLTPGDFARIAPAADGAEPRVEPWAEWGLKQTGNSIADVHAGVPRSGDWPAVLAAVSLVMQQSGLSYRELLDVLATGFGGVPRPGCTLLDPDDPCHPSKMEFTGLGEPQLDWIHRFTRLRRKLECSARELDRSLAVFGGKITDESLLGLSLMRRLQGQLEQPPLALAAVLGAIEVVAWCENTVDGSPVAPSQYDATFQNNALRRSDAFDRFRLDASGKDLAYLADLKSGAAPDSASSHALFVAAALGLSPSSVLLAVDVTHGLAVPDVLNRKTLTTLFGVATLCRGLQLEVNELVRWQRLLGTAFFAIDEPVARAKGLIALAECVDFARETGTSLDELCYLLRHETAGAFADIEPRLLAALVDIRAALQGGAVLGNPSRENLVAQLNKLGVPVAALTAIGSDAGLTQALRAEIAIDPAPTTAPMIPKELGTRFTYREVEGGAAAVLACRGEVSAADFILLAAVFGASAGELQQRQALVRDALVSQLIYFPSPEFTAKDALTSRVSIPEYLAPVVDYDDQSRLRMRGVLDAAQSAVLQSALPQDLAAQLVDLATQCGLFLQKHTEPNLLDRPSAESLLSSAADEAVGDALSLLVPHVEADLLTSRLGPLFTLDSLICAQLLKTLKVTDASGAASSPLALLTAAALLKSDSTPSTADPAVAGALRALILLDKSGRLLAGKTISARDLARLQDPRGQVLRFDTLPTAADDQPKAFVPWRAWNEFFTLRNVIAGGTTTLSALLAPGSSGTWPLADALTVLAEAYQLSRSEVEAACAAELLDMQSQTHFSQPRRLLQLVRLLHVSKLIGADMATVKALIAAEPLEPAAAAARDEEAAGAARKLFMAQFDAATLPARLQPISDRLRRLQRDALVGHLVTRDRLEDGNALLDHYLIDVKMEPCMRTSRIKQAISSVQLFVQRCLLNLESDSSVLPSQINATQWRWMKSYRVWEANRKIFLYPENWIEPDLRDDKTEIFKSLESDLMRESLDHALSLEAFEAYLDRAMRLLRMTVVSTWNEPRAENSGTTVYILARDNGESPAHYFRTLVLNANGTVASWTPWEGIDGAIKSQHVFLFKFWGALHLAYPAITVDETNRNWKIALEVRRKNREGWSAPKRSKEQLIHPRVPNKTEATSLLFMLDTPADRDVVQMYCLGADASEFAAEPRDGTLVIKAPRDKDTGGPETLTLACGFLERFKDGDGVAFYRTVTLTYIFVATLRILGSDIPGLPLSRTPVSATGISGKFDFSAAVGQIVSALTIIVIGNDARHVQSSQKVELDLSEMREGSLTRDFVFDVRESCVQTDSASDGPINPDRSLNFERVTRQRSGAAGSAFDFEIREGLDIVLTDSEPPYVWSQADGMEFYCSGLRKRKGKDFDSVRTRDLIGGSLTDTTGQYTLALRNPLSSARTAYFYRDDAWTLYLTCTDTGTGLRLFREGQPWLSTGFKTLLNNTATFDEALPVLAGDAPVDLAAPSMLGDAAYANIDLDQIKRCALTAFEYVQPASIYDWEVFFHAPLLIACQLSSAQRFEEAQRWFHTIFNPTANPTGSGGGAEHYWRFEPFKREARTAWGVSIDDEMAEFAKGSVDLRALIDRWRNDPFKPHLVARYRIRAYQWAVVIKYIDNLIAWADQLFRRDTIESINEATQLYVLVARILGPRPQSVPKAPSRALAYRDLFARWDEFSNAWVTVEDMAGPWQIQPGSWDNLPQTHPVQSVGHLYFCIPPNESLVALWDLVDDRLFKIRHCMNIDGVERRLPLFEPPIDPALLVKAAAAGLDISTVLADASAPLPLYRFNVMLQKALELCAEVRAVGASLLSALEKKDAEDLALKRSEHEIDLLTMMLNVKRQQIDEARLNAEGLSESRISAELRYSHFQRQMGKSQIVLPKLDAAVTMEPVPLNLASSGANSSDAGLGLSRAEADQLTNMEHARNLTIAAGVMNILASGAFFVGASGFLAPIAQAIGHGHSQIANLLTAIGGFLDSQSRSQGIVSTHERRRNDWVFQSNMALREMRQIDKQIAAAEIRVAIANSELNNLGRQAEHAQDVDEFMRSKFSSSELYRWMRGQLSSTYLRTYQLAYELAKRAERCFRFELGLTDTSYIQFGNWDNLKKGLLAGERLHLDLKRMEAAYLERNKREYEITKHVSLLQVDPMALVALRQTGRCEFTVPEIAFDMDCPGHYMRRIKSASLSIPCVTGPYTGVHCKLTLLSSAVRAKTSGTDYGEPSVDDDRFVFDYSAIQSVVTSGALVDSGLFEMNLRDERYLPFEGAGAHSTWRLELPDEIRQFDYDTISDIVVHLRYTAREGGEQLRSNAVKACKAALSAAAAAGSVRLFSIRREFPNDWASFSTADTTKGRVKFKVSPREEYFPIWMKAAKTGKAANKVVSAALIARPSADAATDGLCVFYGAEGSKSVKLSSNSELGGLLWCDLLSSALVSTKAFDEVALYFDSNKFDDLWLAIGVSTEMQ